MSLSSNPHQELQTLDGLLTQYFSQNNLQNTQVKLYEQKLQEYKSMALVEWRFFKFAVLETRGEYVLWFCLSVFEELFLKHYKRLAPEDLSEIKTFLFAYQHEPFYANMSMLSKNKYLKTLTAMIKKEWSQAIPDLFSALVLMVQAPAFSLDGLSAIQILCEEIQEDSQSDLTTARRAELKSLLLLDQNLPTVLQMVTLILEQQSIPIFTIPLPFSSSEAEQFYRSLYSSSLPAGAIANQAVQAGQQDQYDLIRCALKLCSQLYTWVPLTEVYLPAKLLERITVFSRILDPKYEEISKAAMSLLLEFTAVKRAPMHLPDFLSILFKNTFSLLDLLQANMKGPTLLEDLEDFLTTFVEHQKNILLLCIGRLDYLTQIPVPAYLSKLKAFMPTLPNFQLYMHAMEIWVDLLAELEEKRLSGKIVLGSPYYDLVREIKPALCEFYVYVFEKCLYAKNCDELSALDRSASLVNTSFSETQAALYSFNENKADDSLISDRQALQESSIDFISKGNTFYTLECFGFFSPYFANFTSQFSHLKSMADAKLGYALPGNFTGYANFDIPTVSNRELSFFLKDFAFLLELLGTFTPVLFDGPAEYKEAIPGMFVSLTSFFSWDASTSASVPVRDDTSTESLATAKKFFATNRCLEDIVCQALGSLAYFPAWLGSRLEEEAPPVGNGAELAPSQAYSKILSMVMQVFDIAAMFLDPCFSDDIFTRASRVLNALATYVRRKEILAHAQFVQIQENICFYINKRPLTARKPLLKALSSAYLIPWTDLVSQTDQAWHDRCYMGKERFFKRLLVPYLNLPMLSSLPGHVVPRDIELAVNASLQNFTCIAEVCAGLPAAPRDALYAWFEGSIESNLAVRLNEKIVIKAALDLFIQIFSNLRRQLHPSFFEGAVNNLTTLISIQDITNQPVGSAQRRINLVVLEKVIAIVKLISLDPLPKIRPLIPGFFEDCQERLKPLIFATAKYDLLIEYFDLMHEVILMHWDVFILGKTPVTQESLLPALSVVFLDYLDCLRQKDFELTRTILSHLESLNTKRRLFHREFFKANLLDKFQCCVLDLLSQNDLPSLYPEFARLLHDLSLSGSVPSVFMDLIPQLVHSKAYIGQKEKAAIIGFSQSVANTSQDLPSFSRSLKAIVDDICHHYYISI